MIMDSKHGSSDLIVLFVGYGMAIQCKMFVTGIVDGSVKESSVGVYTAFMFLLHTRGMWNPCFIDHNLCFEFDAML